MSAKSGLSIVCLQLGPRIHRVAGCPLFRGCLSIEVNGRTVGTFRIVRYIMGVCSDRGSTVDHVQGVHVCVSVPCRVLMDTFKNKKRQIQL